MRDDATDELTALLSSIRRGHPDSTIDVAILRRHGITAYGCMRQAIVELTSRIEHLIEFAQKLGPLACCPDEPRAVRPTRSEIRHVVQVAREAARFLAHARYLAAALGPIDDARRDQLERELLEALVVRNALTGWLGSGRIPSGAWDTMLATTGELRARLQFLFTHPAQLQARYEALAGDGMRELPPVSDADVRELIGDVVARYPEVQRVAELGDAHRLVDDRDVLQLVEGVADHPAGQQRASGDGQLEGDDALRRGGVSPHICAEG